MTIEQQIEKIVEARAELGAALTQALPSDDQIIVGHVREAHAILAFVVAAMRMQKEQA